MTTKLTRALRQCQIALLVAFSWHLPAPSAHAEESPSSIKLDARANPPANGGGERGRIDSPFVVMTFNTGTTLRLRHDEGPDDGYDTSHAQTSDRWYGNGLAWLPAIEAARTAIRAIDPDIVAFQEIFDCRECAKIPQDKRTGYVCEEWSEGGASVARRVLGEEYQIAYHPGKRDKCLAVHQRFGSFKGSRDDGAEVELEGHPIDGCGSGARVARATIRRINGNLLTVISIHGTSGALPKDQECRVRQVERIFTDFGDGKPGVRGDANIILGDFNTDPGRSSSSDPSATRWNDFVGPEKRFHFVSHVGPLAPRAYRGRSDIDHVVSDTFHGTCRYVGVDKSSAAVWHGVYFDHVPVVCTLAD